MIMFAGYSCTKVQVDVCEFREPVGVSVQVSTCLSLFLCVCLCSHTWCDNAFVCNLDSKVTAALSPCDGCPEECQSGPPLGWLSLSNE